MVGADPLPGQEGYTDRVQRFRVEDSHRAMRSGWASLPPRHGSDGEQRNPCPDNRRVTRRRAARASCFAWSALGTFGSAALAAPSNRQLPM